MRKAGSERCVRREDGGVRGAFNSGAANGTGGSARGGVEAFERGNTRGGVENLEGGSARDVVEFSKVAARVALPIA